MSARDRSKKIDETLDKIHLIKVTKLKSDDSYVFPSEYKATNNIFQRLSRIYQLQTNMIHELRVREDLTDESVMLFFLTLSLSSILQMLIFSIDPSTSIASTSSFVTVTLAVTFGVGYAFIWMIYYFMNVTVKVDKMMTRGEVLRLLAYPYTMYLFGLISFILEVYTSFVLFGLLFRFFFLAWLVFLIVIVKVAYRTNYIWASFGVIVPFTLSQYLLNYIIAQSVALFLGSPFN